MKLTHLLLKGIGAAVFLIVVALATGYITMWLAMEKDVVQLARVIGMDQTAALELLRGQGLQPKVTGREYNEQHPKDTVLSQRPASGTWVRKGGEVRLVVSRGSDVIAIPNLAGLPLAQAQQLLLQQGLIVGRIAQVHSPDRPKGEVIAQDPEAGVLNRRGSAVALLVSLGQAEEPADFLTPPSATFRNIMGGEGGPVRTP
jgi:serine/threonine-protein kinase